MKSELASVLAEPSFLRSPVLARLLTFLVETTLRGDARKLKSYAVAVDGLGRSPELDPQIDTYARVQVARLRKALDAVYAGAGAGAGAGARRDERLTIDSGSYEVRLVAHVPPEPEPEPEADFPAGEPHGAPPPPRASLARRLIMATAVLALLGAAIGTALHWRAEAQAAAAARWKAGNFPSVIVSVSQRDGRPANESADLLRQELLMRINGYQGMRVIYDDSAKADYAVNVNLYRSGRNLLANTFVVDRKAGRVAWSSSDIVEPVPEDRQPLGNPYVARTAFTIAQATGIIHSNERRRNLPTDTPYGCWLRFTIQMPNNRLVNDPALAECARDWNEAVPDHPLAASLYAWTLVDQSIVAGSEDDRRDLLDEALQTIQRARMLNPASGIAAAVAIRVYAIADEDLAMRGAAEQALRLNPGNLEVEGLAGTMLALRDDPRGEALLDDAITQHPNPPPWYFIAKFVATMMREDTAGAGAALVRLRQLNHAQPVLPIFTAAYEARIGQLGQARSSWERAKGAQPILRADPDVFLDRTPLGPRAITRLKQWLAPALGQF